MSIRRKRGIGTLGRRRGQSLVELAFILPLLISLVMGVVDFGWILYANVQVASAAGSAARAGALYAADLSAPSVTDNDAPRLAAIKKAVLDNSTTPAKTYLGLLKTDSTSNFNVDTDVIVSYPSGTPPNNARQGQDVIVTVRYRQPVWFQVLPGVNSGTFQVSTTARARIQ